LEFSIKFIKKNKFFIFFSIIYISFTFLLIFNLIKHYSILTPKQNLFYLGLLAFKLIFFNIFFKKNRYLLRLIYIYIFLSLYLFEGYSTFYLNIERYNFDASLKNKVKIYKSNKNLEYDTRSKFEAFKQEKKIFPGIVLSTYGDLEDKKNFNKIMPLAGISNSKTLFCNENGYYAFYESDRFGFNNPDKAWDNDIFELILVGDSFTHGHCVFEKDNFSGNLKRLYNQSNILNLGYNANGPLKELATIKEYSQHKRIKKLLWLYYEGNDLQDLENEVKNPILERYLTTKIFTQNLKENQINIDKVLREKILAEEENFYKNETDKKIIKFKSFLKLNITRNVLINKFKIYRDSQKIENLSNLEKVLIEAKEYSNKNNIEFIFIYLPEYRRYDNNLKTENHRNYNQVIELLNHLNIKNIDLVKEIETEKISPANLFPFKIISHVHYSELGYQILSEVIFKRLKN
jgi:hypothetical protein